MLHLASESKASFSGDLEEKPFSQCTLVVLCIIDRLQVALRKSTVGSVPLRPGLCSLLHAMQCIAIGMV